MTQASAGAPTASGAPVVLYGIPNCDQVRRARAWLRDRGIEHRFHDLRVDGLAAPLLARWLSQLPWDQVLNRRGTTWRALPQERRDTVSDQASAADAMLAQPTLVRRPVLERGEALLIGFSEAAYERAFAGDGARGER